MLNYADSNSFFVSFPAYLKTVENVKEDVGILQVLSFEFLKFRILDIFFIFTHATADTCVICRAFWFCQKILEILDNLTWRAQIGFFFALYLNKIR